MHLILRCLYYSAQRCGISFSSLIRVYISLFESASQRIRTTTNSHQGKDGRYSYYTPYNPAHLHYNTLPLLLPLPPRIKRLQRIHLPTPPNNLPPPPLNKLLPIRLWHIQTNKANILRFPATRKQVIGNVFEMGLYAGGVVEGLVVAEVG